MSGTTLRQRSEFGEVVASVEILRSRRGSRFTDQNGVATMLIVAHHERTAREFARRRHHHVVGDDAFGQPRAGADGDAIPDDGVDELASPAMEQSRPRSSGLPSRFAIVMRRVEVVARRSDVEELGAGVEHPDRCRAGCDQRRINAVNGFRFRVRTDARRRPTRSPPGCR